MRNEIKTNGFQLSSVSVTSPKFYTDSLEYVLCSQNVHKAKPKDNLEITTNIYINARVKFWIESINQELILTYVHQTEKFNNIYTMVVFIMRMTYNYANEVKEHEGKAIVCDLYFIIHVTN